MNGSPVTALARRADAGTVRLGLRDTRVVYLTAPAAREVTDPAAASLPPLLAARVTIRDLPPGASV